MPRRAGFLNTCKYQDCTRDHYALGWCKQHYAQSRSGRGMAPIQERSGRPVVRVERCTAMYQHEGESRQCNDPVLAKGYCPGHYRQNHLGREFTAIKKRA